MKLQFFGLRKSKILVFLCLLGSFVSNSALAATNLVPNSSFESLASDGVTPLGWHKGGYGTNTPEYLYPSTGSDGVEKAVKVSLSSYADGDAKWHFDEVSVQGLSEYTYSDSYKSNVPSALIVQYTLSDNTHQYVQIATLPSSDGAWASISKNFSPSTNVVSATVFHVINSTGELTLARPSLSITAPVEQNNLGQGIVSLSFDDGWASQYDNALPILNSAGVRGTFYIISNTLSSPEGADDGYMTTPQVLALQDAGHEIGAHTLDHCDLSALSVDPNLAKTTACASPLATSSTAEQQIAASRSALLGIGATPVSTLAYPYGSYNSTVEHLVESAGLSAARSVDAGFNTKASDVYALKNQIIDSTITFAPNGLDTVKSWVDTALQNKVWLVLTIHQVESASEITQRGDSEATTPEFLQQVVSYLKSKNVSIKTVQEGVALMKGTNVPPPPVPIDATIGASASLAGRQFSPGSSSVITTKVNSSANTSNVIVDTEIYDSANNKVSQNIVSGNLNVGETFANDWNIALPSTSGSYRVKVGVFSFDWSKLYTWNNSAGVFTIGTSTTTLSGQTFPLQILQPVDNVNVSGLLEIKGSAVGADIDSYVFGWRAGTSGDFIDMPSDPSNSFKHNFIDFTNWNWNSDQKYPIYFQASDLSGNVIGSTSVTVVH